jgi:hypothetical protein
MASTNTVRKGLPSAVQDGSDAPNWGGRYGEQIVQVNNYPKMALAEEGCYYVATNPTPGTGLAATSSITNYVTTAGAVGVFFLLTNTETSTTNTGKRVYMDYIRVRLISQAPTSASVWYMTIALDNSTTRYNTGGTAITPVNVSGDYSKASIVTMYAGAVSTTVPGSVRLITSVLVRAQVPVIMDQYMLTFGSVEGGGADTTSASVQNRLFGAPPVIIAPSWNMAVTMWGTSNAAAPQWEFDMGWWEK